MANPLVRNILRKKPRPGGDEFPPRTKRGYELADPRLAAAEWHKVENATFVDTLDEAADLIENRGFALRMKGPGKRASLVRPKSLRILR